MIVSTMSAEKSSGSGSQGRPRNKYSSAKLRNFQNDEHKYSSKVALTQNQQRLSNMIASSAVGAMNSIENNLHHIDGDQQSLHSVYQRRLLLQQLNESCYDVTCVQDRHKSFASDWRDVIC